MFPFPIATPQGCNIQTFYGSGLSSDVTLMSWNKPVGVSHVYMMLIGQGGNGSGGGSGGCSGAVTVWYGAAQHVPNNLVVRPASGGDTQVFYRGNSLITLLQAESGSSTIPGAATAAPAFAASGFYKSTAGQDGEAGNLTASTTTFLSGGGSSSVTANYGYSTPNNGNGFFQMQPIIFGVGGVDAGKGGIGCGGGSGSSVGKGGPGMVLIASW